MLRYDKRTYAIWNLDLTKITVDEEVIEDGVAAVRLLRARRDVAQDRIFVIGHSLGAMLAPEIAKKAWPVAGLVMLAPAGRRLPQTDGRADCDFWDKRRPLNSSRSSARRTNSRRTRCRATQNFFNAPASYYYDLDARDEVAIARSLDVPILILHGARDYQVIDEDIRDWQNGLKGEAEGAGRNVSLAQPSVHRGRRASPRRPSTTRRDMLTWR